MKAILTLAAVVLCGFTACGGTLQAPPDDTRTNIELLDGSWGVTVEIRVAGGDPTAPEPAPIIAYAASMSGHATGPHGTVDIAGFCPESTVTLGSSEQRPYWNGTAECARAQEATGCESGVLNIINVVAEEFTTENDVRFSGAGVLTGCGARTPVLIRAYAHRQ